MRITTLLLFLVIACHAKAQDLNWQSTLPVYPNGATSHSYTGIGNPAVDLSINTSNPNYYTNAGGYEHPRVPVGSPNRLLSFVNYTSNTQCQSVTFTFSAGVANLNFNLYGIDRGTLATSGINSGFYNFVDKVTITGSLSGHPVTPTVGNTSGGFNIVSENTIEGIADGDGASNNVNFNYVDQVTITHCSGTQTQANPIMQSFGIGNMSWDGPLPVNWLSFDGKVINQSIQLLWKTASETNNELFEIERSVDAINFDKLGEISGNGNSAIESSYIYYDEVPLPGINYYRLKQTDFDGSYDYSKIIGIRNHAEQSAFSIFPNPVQSGQSLYVKSSTPIQSLKLFDLMGIETEISLKTNDEISTENIRPGKYILKTRFSDGLINDRQIVIK